MFKPFDLCAFFDISTTKSVDRNKVNFVDDGEYDFIGRTAVDWGIQGKLHKLSFEPNPKDSFSLVQVGETVALWRECEWYASQNLFLLNPKVNGIKENNLYFQAVINKEMCRYGSGYNSYPTMKSLESTKIFLPVIENSNPDYEYTVDDIDWQYMRDYISDMEYGSMSVLDTYLQATGLDDYELTDEDKAVLSVLPNFGSFKVGELFDVSTGSLLKMKEVSSGNVPRISAKSDNNGILGYYDTETIPEARHFENFISVNFFGNAFYHPYRVSLEMKVHCLTLKKRAFTENIAMYCVTALNKLFSQQNYSYGNQLSSRDLKKSDLYVELPVASDGSPDFDYMERYIRAIEKQTIGDVVKYKDSVIETTKTLVGSNE